MKIALCGSQTHSAHLAPYEDKSWEEHRQGLPRGFPHGGLIQETWVNEDWDIWGCSPGAAGQVRRATRWFEVHRWEPGKPWLSLEYVRFLKEFKGPVYTGGVIEEIPNHVVYPLERVETEFSSYFLTSSLALMCAMAILEIEDDRRASGNGHERDDVIGFWGVDMSAGEEWGYQRAGCQFFLLEALRRGIGIYVPPESCLLRPMPVYGLSEWHHTYIKLTQRARELNGRKEAAIKAYKEAEQTLAGLSGAMEDLNYMVNTWTSPYGLPSGVVLKMGKEHVERQPVHVHQLRPAASPQGLPE